MNLGYRDQLGLLLAYLSQYNVVVFLPGVLDSLADCQQSSPDLWSGISTCFSGVWGSSGVRNVPSQISGVALAMTQGNCHLRKSEVMLCWLGGVPGIRFNFCYYISLSTAWELTYLGYLTLWPGLLWSFPGMLPGLIKMICPRHLPIYLWVTDFQCLSSQSYSMAWNEGWENYQTEVLNFLLKIFKLHYSIIIVLFWNIICPHM